VDLKVAIVTLLVSAPLLRQMLDQLGYDITDFLAALPEHEHVEPILWTTSDALVAAGALASAKLTGV